jgi:hypothetical protein
MRWLVPWFLLGMFITSMLLAPGSALFGNLLWLQLVGYPLVVAAHWVPTLRNIAPVRIAYYCVQLNVALVHTGLSFLQGGASRSGIQVCVDEV